MMYRVVSVIKYSEAETISFFLFIGLFLPLCLSAFCFSGFTFFVLKFIDFIFCLITLSSAAFSLRNMTACCFSFTLFLCSFSRFLKGEEVRFPVDSVFLFHCLNTGLLGCGEIFSKIFVADLRPRYSSTTGKTASFDCGGSFVTIAFNFAAAVVVCVRSAQICADSVICLRRRRRRQSLLLCRRFFEINKKSFKLKKCFKYYLL